MTDLSYTKSPIEDMNYKFSAYLEKKKAFEKKHLGGNGLPDYAFKLDYEYRKTLDAVPGLYKFVKTLAATYVPKTIHEYSLKGIAVGPDQYPEIYNMVRECAEILGIGVPNLYIVPGMLLGDQYEEFNAMTLACDDVEPVIIVTGLIVERFTAEELKSIIAHECGHIHNNHTVYNLLENLIVNFGFAGLSRLCANIPGADAILALLTQGTQLKLNVWSRAAEVSADRAALICTGNLDATKNAFAKFMYNGADLSQSTTAQLNLEALREQMDLILNSPYRFSELSHSHPLPIKRVFATIDFSECETYYEWRPDLKKPTTKLYPKNEIDERCRKYLGVVMTKGAKK